MLFLLRSPCGLAAECAKVSAHSLEQGEPLGTSADQTG